MHINREILCTQFADYSTPITKVLLARIVFNGRRTNSASIASPSVLLHQMWMADHLIQVSRLNIHFMSWESKLNLPIWDKNRPQNWDIKQGPRLYPSRLKVAAFIGVYSIFIGTSYLLVCPVICSCCWPSSRSGGAVPCFSVVLSPIPLLSFPAWKIQGNITHRIYLMPLWMLNCLAHVLLQDTGYTPWTWKRGFNAMRRFFFLDSNTLALSLKRTSDQWGIWPLVQYCVSL